MRSTGEVLGLANSYGAAIFKAEEATQTKLPTSGRVLISVSDRDKKMLLLLLENIMMQDLKLWLQVKHLN